MKQAKYQLASPVSPVQVTPYMLMHPSSGLTLAEGGEFWYHLILVLIKDSSNDALQRISIQHIEMIVYQRNMGQIPDEILPLKNIKVLMLHLHEKNNIRFNILYFIKDMNVS